MDNDMNETGNGMVVRETMKKCLQILRKNFSCKTGNFIIFYNHDIDHVINLMNSALIEQPRNCDIKSICDDSHRAWLDDEENWDDFGSPYLEQADWLLSKAKKGGENNS